MLYKTFPQTFIFLLFQAQQSFTSKTENPFPPTHVSRQESVCQFRCKLSRPVKQVQIYCLPAFDFIFEKSFLIVA